MIYFEDINLLEQAQNSTNFYITTRVMKCKDEEGIYWRGQIIPKLKGKDQDEKIWNCYTIVTADSLEEMQVWFDLHCLNIDSVYGIQDIYNA